jgi:hypothetical protein
MVRHATSHGFAVFMCTILSALLIEVLAPLIPKYIGYLENISKFIVTFFALPFSVKEFNIVLVASFLAMFWGVFFKLQNKKYYGNR